MFSSVVNINNWVINIRIEVLCLEKDCSSDLKDDELE